MPRFYSEDATGTYDIIIVGGGMVGACLAALLGEAAQSSKSFASLKIGIIDNAPLLENKFTNNGFDPRVSALTIASQRILESIGAWPLMSAERLTSFRAMDVWDAEGTGSIHFDAEDLGEIQLGYIVENRVIHYALMQRCNQYSQIEFLCPEKIVRIEKQTAEVSLTLASGRTIQTKLLVGADGANSFVREQLNFAMQVRSYHHDAIVTTVKTEKSHQSTAWQRFTPSGPVALLPLEKHCSIVWSTSPEDSAELLELDDESFCLALTRAFEGRLGKIEWCDKRFSFPLKQRHVEEYVHDNVALVGDAAHTIHPLAGQGVNLGLLDAAVLAEELCRGMESGLEPGLHAILRRYERRRKGPNLAMMNAMSGFKQLFSADNLKLRLIRNVGMNLVNQTSHLKNTVMAQAMGLSGDLPRSAKTTAEVDLLI